MKLDDTFRNRQSETGATGIVGARGRTAIRAVKNMFEILWGDAAPRIPNLDADFSAAGEKLQRDRAVGRRVSQSVVDQILENAASFSIPVIVREEESFVVLQRYYAQKTTWDEWWARHRDDYTEATPEKIEYASFEIAIRAEDPIGGATYDAEDDRVRTSVIDLPSNQVRERHL